MKPTILGTAAVLATLRCTDGLGTGATGLTGQVVRGPVTPVCVAERPCDAPFSAHFTVLRDQRRVADFTSDTLGNFLVHLPPGTYMVRAADDAPIMSPQFQVKQVVVGADALTTVTLEFDTGIR